MQTRTTRGFIALALSLGMLVPQVALAASTFYGTVVHVSMNNIKVYNPASHQTLSFEVLPKFDQIFSGDGKETYQMKDVRAGRYVGIIYDQSGLGMRHADRIYIMNNANQHIGQQ
jgi:hypothetical protein